MRKMMRKLKKLNRFPRQHFQSLAVFVIAFAALGSIMLLRSFAAPGLCSTANVIGTSTVSVSAPETAQYRLWVRMQVPDTTNTNNTNGVRVELAGSSNQCFTVTTTNSNTVNQWQWVNSDATAASTAHITSQLTQGNYTAKILGMKAGVKVDKVLFLRSDSTCIPSNNLTNGQPGDNCTTPSPTVTLSANPTSVVSGSASTLTWSSANATSCTASGAWSGSRSVAGSVSTGNLTANSTYTLTCTGVGGSNAANTTVTVTAPAAPTLSLSANPTSVVTGSASTLTWSSTNATSCTASDGWSGSRPTSGSASTGNLTANRTFTLTCTGAGGSVTRSATVSVTSSPPPSDSTPPTITVTIPGITIGTQQSITVRTLKEIRWQPLASDASGIRSFVLTVNNQPVTLTNGEVRIGGTANGDYALRAVATDNAGNVTTWNLLIRLRHPDFNRNGRVHLDDLTQILRNWSTSSNVYDLNADGNVHTFDFTYVLNQWGSTQ